MSKTLPHVLEDSTVSALIDEYMLVGSWRRVAARLQTPISFAAMAAGAHGKPGAISQDGEALLRQALGLPPLAVAAMPCPTCGQAHNLDADGKPLDCGGQDVSAVILPAGARIVRPAQARKPIRRRWRVDLSSYAGRITSADVRRLIEEYLS